MKKQATLPGRRLSISAIGVAALLVMLATGGEYTEGAEFTATREALENAITDKRLAKYGFHISLIPAATLAAQDFDNSQFPTEQRRPGGRRHQPGLRRGRLDAQIEGALGGIGQHLPRPLEQGPELDLGARRPYVRHDLPPAAVVLGDLHGRRPGCRPHPPNPRHDTEPRAPISA
jgi:hypothetical protein